MHPECPNRYMGYNRSYIGCTNVGCIRHQVFKMGLVLEPKLLFFDKCFSYSRSVDEVFNLILRSSACTLTSVSCGSWPGRGSWHMQLALPVTAVGRQIVPGLHFGTVISKFLMYPVESN